MKKIYIHMMMLAAMVVAGATMVSCSKEEIATGKFKMSINATKGGDSSKQLNLEGTTLNATWAEGEQVRVYKEETLLGTLTAQTTGSNTTTLDGTLEGTLATDDVLTLKFCSPNYTTQLGTLEYIAANCDYATATVTVASVDGGVVRTAERSAAFVNQQAIVKFSLVVDEDDESTPLSATKLVVNDGSNNYTVTPASGTAEFYVAIPDIDGQTITLYADTDPCYIYAFERTGVTFTKGEYYEVTVKMARYGIDLARMTMGTNATALDGDVITGTLGGFYFQVSIAAGASVTLRDAIVDRGDFIMGNGLTCEGDATIILVGENTLNVANEISGIYVPSGSTLTIQGSGSLIARGANGCAGIGANSGNDCGNIVINSGTINAYGRNNSGAGIGGTNSHSCGTITINGGTVNAESDFYGAGIGSGERSSCGDISITGGTVTAKGGQYGAGIGSGRGGDCSDIIITGGTITAIGDGGKNINEVGGGAGIGSGQGGACGDITITNAVTSVTATAKFPYFEWSSQQYIYGCCIGKGYGASCGMVTVGGEEYPDGISTNTDPHTYTYTPSK